MTLVLVKGAGEHATGAAHRLFRCGFRVVMTELERPTAVRLRVSFCTAVYEGAIEVEGVPARGYALEDFAGIDGSHVPVVVDPECTLLRLKPDVVLDARILKRNADTRIDQAPLVIGYGPGLQVGRDVHYAVETNRGHDLGRILTEGEAAPDTGVPGVLGGHGRARVLRAPGAGVFTCVRTIGDLVEEGELVASVGGVAVRAGVGGVLRGHAYPGSPVQAGQKVGDVDPRGVVEACRTLSDKARTLSGAVLELVCSR